MEDQSPFDVLEAEYPIPPDEITFILPSIKCDCGEANDADSTACRKCGNELEPIEEKRRVPCRAKCVSDMSIKVEIGRKIDAGVETMKKRAPDEWKKFLPADLTVMKGVMLINIMMIDPAITIPKALEWAKTRASLVQDILIHLNREYQIASANREAEEVEKEKND